MKKKIYVILGILLMTSCIFSIRCQTVSLEDAKIIASKWNQFLKKENVKGLNTTKIKDISLKTEKGENLPSFYSVNFEGGGHVIVSGEASVGPILAYSKSSSFNEGELSEEEQTWLMCVSGHIQQKRNKKEKLRSTPSLDVDNLIQNLSTKSTVISVPPLFETYQTSRWAGWGVYSSEFPDGNDNGMGCVPIAMAQIIKYHRFPIQGKGNLNGMDFSRQRYNYDMMPFRLTYCDDPTWENCNDGSFNVIPGVTADHIREVSLLIHHCAIAVGWTPEGTRGHAGNWASAMVNYFDYSPGFTYRDFSYIKNNNEAFKASLRNELINKRPILLAYRYISRKDNEETGHAVVVDGVENNNYFHYAVGRGGSEDTYYYLFDLDNDGVHTTPEDILSYDAAYGIQPNCPQSSVNLNNLTILSSENKTYLSNDVINISNFTIKNGGRITLQATNEVIFGNNFDAEIGSDIYITVGRCGPP